VRSWRGCAGLAALALASQAAALRLVEITHYAVYQHYRPLEALAGAPNWALGILLLQLVVVLVGAWNSRSSIAQTITAARDGWLWVVLALTAAAASIAVPVESVRRTAEELVLGGMLLVVSLLNVGLAARAAPSHGLVAARRWFDERLSLSDDQAAARVWDAKLPWVAAAFVFQAKYLSTGQLSLPAPPDSAAFHVDEVVMDRGRWFGYGFPGWPAVLALGAWLGAPWIVNPVLGALAVLLTHAVTRRVYGLGTANVVTMLLALSPWQLIMSAEFMGHPLSLVLGLLALLALTEARERPVRWAIVGGIAMGALLLTRPIDAIFFGLAFIVWMIVESHARVSFSALALGGVLAGLIAAIVFPYNQALTGSATLAPHMMWTDRRWGPGVDRLGFGSNIGIPVWRNIDPLPGHGIADVMLNLNKNLFTANWELFGWACGSLVLLIAYLATGGFRKRDTLMLAVAGSFIVGHSAYWFSGGPDLGPRYWYPAIVALVALACRGGAELAQRLRSTAPDAAGRIALFATVATLGGVLIMLPWRVVTKQSHYRGVSGDVRRVAASRHIVSGLVFIRSPFREDYQSAFNLNPSTLDDAATIYAYDAGLESRRRVVARFSNRSVWVIGRPDSSAALRLLSGPLPPGTVP
jgi:hypothetical protein